ncbi:TPA: IS630 family transposase [Legionella pneumophila]|uniref:IS630 family transposase n=1 Tax=Legionella pneumophila TaxID=446 RepID=UPI00077093E1|nr:IS630 family transposase [Legionella pneumophila]HAT9053358.1 IS630 family transposase [Legionella pneumophila subsp. pneumophila]RYW80589.1 IS630 family transposase [Legionella pneumophila]CZK12918.1 Transposase and inactivated derivatives [Legionella pneumophila]HAT9164338.1 IS630 family transposase [Legionella pneumophila subsp. pneumophila]HAT9351903.1 IS630 family transposase [Legionella pneumophila subsp. pneumophila]
MKRLFLTKEEKESLEVRHQNCEDRKEGDRIKAILLRSEGWTVPKISQALRIHQSTIIRHIQDYQAGKLKNESGGSSGQLTEAQTQELIAHLEAQTYHHNHEIILYVKERYGVSYTVPGMHKWLHRNGFNYKKPKGRPHKAAPELQKQFIAEYETLKEEVGSDEPILFMDAVHPTQATRLSYGWIRTGKTKHVDTTASRTRLNIVGAIQLGHIAETITSQYETINAQSIVDFMGKIRSQYGSKTVHLILDRSGYHRASLIAEKAEELGIKLRFLPPYSPNLNPIERLWKVMNEKVRNNRFFKGPKDFKEAISGFFEDILPSIGNELNERINDNFQTLKT